MKPEQAYEQRTPQGAGVLSDVLTVDVEDYYHVEAFADRVSPHSWSDFPSRVRANTERVLQMFEEYSCRATFFVLGWVAEQDPALIREIVAAGHEVACHSYRHRLVSSQTPGDFREDLRRGRAAIEDAAGVRVLGYRAPSFSIGPGNVWALEILSEEGFLYDSSIFPIRHDVYGFPGAPRFPYRMEFRSERSLVEIPLTTVRMGRTTWPASGGGYLRLLPMQYTRWAIRRIHEKERQSFVLYFHPWEIDPDQPRITGRWKSNLRHYLGLGTMETRLRELLAHGRYVPAIDLARRYDSSTDVSTRNAVTAVRI